ncbi:hypothetical protein PF010_g11763 [Phytophthora fragariae]|uniref:Secreted protein n=1 Tax=Phytophthora fragariae TaxID=53985 RepID=A0A6A3Z3K7_9STRA|nr:hypothetical protein PF009_g13886 [Phytophthora fragariae]KAE9016021.1 hypothetical protein PF011_g7363 [Phytophthora fragariae]KAE9108827.1 hypothetical protein PF010_g11763 [Phytophthora fragariae]KAE9109126.1 hypothetical protein PF007_g12371 [Phytophthora fragariae]KAE9147740.1 hypothetical protein PF006_g7607 [Phytophthora fragariae]
MLSLILASIAVALLPSRSAGVGAPPSRDAAGGGDARARYVPLPRCPTCLRCCLFPAVGGGGAMPPTSAAVSRRCPRPSIGCCCRRRGHCRAAARCMLPLRPLRLT